MICIVYTMARGEPPRVLVKRPTGPRNLLKIVREFPAVAERVRAAHAGLLAGAVWVEIDGFERDVSGVADFSSAKKTLPRT